ncbi:FecR family protein [Flavitalea flava]
MDGVEASIEKLIKDDSFINFCLKKDEQDIAIWETILLTQPEKKALIYAAKDRLLVMAAAIREGERDLAVERLSKAMDALDNTHEKSPKEKRLLIIPFFGVERGSLMKRWIMAASVLVFIIGGYLVYNYKIGKGNGSPNNTVKNIIAPKGERKSLRLPDGTQVILDGGSHLILAENFNSQNREVELSGEAYFDVTQDPGRPFIIHTDFMDINVLGTAFNVRAYPDEPTAVTSLIRGRVAITFPDDSVRQKSIILHPMQKIVIGKGSKIISDPALSSAGSSPAIHILRIDSLHKNLLSRGLQETAWTENRLVFNDESLESAGLKLEKWFGIEVVFSGQEIKKLPFTGSFENPNLEKVLETMKLTIPVLQYKIEENKKLILY